MIMAADNKSPDSSGNSRSVVWGFVGLLCGLLAGLVIGLNRNNTENRTSSTVEFDNNGDGKADATFHYDRGVIIRTVHDRNFDGKPDFFEWYKEGIVSRAESDDDFDGKIDGWFTCRNGNWWLSKHDTDRNGVPDVFQYFDHGVIRMAVWRPNESGKPLRIEWYERAVKAKELRDTTGDGLLDTVVMFDVFENQVGEEKLSEPLNAQDAISGIPQMR